MRNESGKLKIFVVRTTLLAESQMLVVGACKPGRFLEPLHGRIERAELNTREVFTFHFPLLAKVPDQTIAGQALFFISFRFNE